MDIQWGHWLFVSGFICSCFLSLLCLGVSMGVRKVLGDLRWKNWACCVWKKIAFPDLHKCILRWRANLDNFRTMSLSSIINYLPSNVFIHSCSFVHALMLSVLFCLSFSCFSLWISYYILMCIWLNNPCMTVSSWKENTVYIFEVKINFITEGTEKWHERNEKPLQISSLKFFFIKTAS